MGEGKGLAVITVAGILAGTYLYGRLRSGAPTSAGGARRVAAALLVGALVVGLAAGVPAQPRGRSADGLEQLLADLYLVPLDGKVAPSLTLKTLDGQEVSLAGLRGRFVLVYYWATWCPYCGRELPSTIEQLHREYKDKGLVVLAVDMEEKPEVVAGWVKGKSLTMPILLDVDGKVNDGWGVTATPTVFLVSRDGRLVAQAVGNRPWMSDKGRKLWALLLAR